jgi:regulator of replication initiation timing
MNRTILIVICDFLLVSLLAFSTVDINKAVEEGVQPTVKVDIATNQLDAGRDVAAVMRRALEEERQNRDLLLGELAATRDAVTERERQTRTLQEQLKSREHENLSLQQQQANLAGQFASAQTNIETLSQQLQRKSVEVSLSQDQLANLEAEARRKSEQAAALKQQLDQMAASNQVFQAEKQQLSTRLQVAEVEKRHATEQVVAMREQVKVEREEKAKLAEGVKTLAAKSGELTEEIRENRALAPNAIFNEFITNRVQASFHAMRSGLLGMDASKRKAAETVLVTDGKSTFALCHVEETPLALWTPGTDWEGLTGTLSGNVNQVAIRSLSFHRRDPRVVLMPVSQADARQLGCNAYHVSAEPYKFQDAVLVGAQEGYYGECKFEIDLSTPDYVKLDRSVLKGMFGKFNPSRGDLVFSKTGQLLGVMANSTYCLMIRDFETAATFQFGGDVRAQRTGQTLSQLHTQLIQLPFKLQ